VKKSGFFGEDDSDEDSDGLGFLGSKAPIRRAKTTKERVNKTKNDMKMKK